MIEPCKSTFAQQFNRYITAYLKEGSSILFCSSPFHLASSMMSHLLSLLCCYYLGKVCVDGCNTFNWHYSIDALITLYHTQYPFYITPSDDDTPTIPLPLKKPANLLIDTSTNTKSPSRQHPQSAYPDVPQLLFSPTSSISSFGSSNYHWSPDDNSSHKRSQVEDMIHLFEHGHRYTEQHRRHSVDSHWSSSSSSSSTSRRSWNLAYPQTLCSLTFLISPWLPTAQVWQNLTRLYF